MPYCCEWWVLFNIVIISLGKKDVGPVVQSIVSLTSSLEDKMLTVLVSMISNMEIATFVGKWRNNHLIKCAKLNKSHLQLTFVLYLQIYLYAYILSTSTYKQYIRL